MAMLGYGFWSVLGYCVEYIDPSPPAAAPNRGYDKAASRAGSQSAKIWWVSWTALWTLFINLGWTREGVYASGICYKSRNYTQYVLSGTPSNFWYQCPTILPHILISMSHYCPIYFTYNLPTRLIKSYFFTYFFNVSLSVCTQYQFHQTHSS